MSLSHYMSLFEYSTLPTLQVYYAMEEKSLIQNKDYLLRQLFLEPLVGFK